MIPPNICYSWPLAKDVMTQPLEVVTRQLMFQTDALGVLSERLVYSVPSDRVMILSHVSTVNTQISGPSWHLDFWTSPSMIDMGTDQSGILSLCPSIASVNSCPQPWSGEVWIPPGRTIWVSGTCGATVVATQAIVIHGITIPRGSVSFA